MTTNTGSQYENAIVKLDNNQFIDCKFINCTLEYSGLGQVGLIKCQFNNVKWLFTGPAKNTLEFLKGLSHGMGEQGKELIEQTFNIQKP